MTDISIFCANPSSYPRENEPVTIGVPFPKGQLSENSQLNLFDQNGRPFMLQTKPLTYWPDGSVKWLQCDFLANLPASGKMVFNLSQKGQVPEPKTPLKISKGSDSWCVDTGAAVFHIDTREFRPFAAVDGASGKRLVEPSEINLIDERGQRWTPRVENLALESEGPVRATIFFSGIFYNGNDEQLRFESRLRLYSNTARAALEMRLHNPRAARHPGNLWDLGDPSSVMLREWSLFLPTLNSGRSSLLIKTDANEDWRELEQNGGYLYQESSGGENWDSPVHRNRTGNVPLTFRGWKFKEGDQVVAEGLRAQPCLLWGNADYGISASIDAFWQRFPKAVELCREGFELSLLPAEFPGGHEIQGGEQITETVRFDFDDQGSGLAWGDPAIHARCAFETYRDAGVFPEGLWTPTNSNYAQLVAVAFDERKGFFAKRELVDEYGWRNFGDLYADHEAAFHKEDRPFVSHYNNQYDPLASFYRQYLTSGNQRWDELAKDLAKHVADIDINHTDEDREEYCHGLFWHTDHYLDAGLATHRTTSREHLNQKNPAFCGGGPAAEHCYTTGLALHYLLTGEPRFREQVVQLAEWCWRSLSGPHTLGAVALGAVRNIKRLVRDYGVLWPRFPFTRGTGNCINATLDALELTGDRSYLKRAAALVRGAVSPSDRPEERDLLDAEASWSYLVFLTALGRFLEVKRERGELDEDYSYAVQSLLLYARWMAENEYPYLDKPEMLEYPNETWNGQDLRKGVVLFYASRHGQGSEKQRFLERGLFFTQEALRRLVNCDTHYFTRPLALVLQNGWAVEALCETLPADENLPLQPIINDAPTSRLTIPSVLKRGLVDFVNVLRQTGPRHEWRWLKARLGKG